MRIHFSFIDEQGTYIQTIKKAKEGLQSSLINWEDGFSWINNVKTNPPQTLPSFKKSTADGKLAHCESLPCKEILNPKPNESYVSTKSTPNDVKVNLARRKDVVNKTLIRSLKRIYSK